MENGENQTPGRWVRREKADNGVPYKITKFLDLRMYRVVQWAIMVYK